MPMTPDPTLEERNWATQDTYLGDGARALGCPTAWDTTRGSRSVYVCVVSDKGTDLAHPDLLKIPNSNLGIVMSTGTPGPTQGAPTGTTAADAYGTAVAAVAAANWSGVGGLGANGQIIGVAPNASIYNLRTSNLNPGSLAAALDQVVAETFVAATAAPPAIPPPAGAAGGPAFPAASYPTLRRVALLPVPTTPLAAPNDVWTAPQLLSLTNALGAGVVVVAAAGQDAAISNSAIVDSIALRSDVIVVGANRVPVATVVGDLHSRSGASVCVSTRGPAIVVGDLTGPNGLNPAAAPGGNAATTFTDVTAAAAAQAAGVAALVLSANARLTSADVRRILRESCEGSALPIDPAGILGFGQLRANLAVAKAILQRADVAVIGGATALECDFGDVEVGATLDKIIELRLKVSGSLSPVTYSVGTLPTNVSAITGAGFENPATLIAVSGAAKQLKLRVTAPSTTGAVIATLLINSDDDRITGTPSNFSVTVKYNVVPVLVVDTVLVLDRSGSMSGAADGGTYRKVDVLIDAAKLYADKLRDGDRLGIVSFDNAMEALLANTISSGVGTGLVVAGNPSTTSMRAHLKTRITAGSGDLGPRGSTSIGGGIQVGGTLLGTQPPATRSARVLFVFTDGLHNTIPDVPTGLGFVPSDARIFAIRAGLSSNTAGDTFFDDLTTVPTKGWATNTGTDLFNIQKLFIKVIADASASDFAIDPDFSLAPGQKIATDVPIGEADLSADFVVLYRATDAFPKYLRVWLELPDGTLAQFQDIAAGSVPGMQAIFDSGHVILRCAFPSNPAKPREHVGVWKVWVQNGLQFDNGELKGNAQRVGTNETLRGAVTATVKSNLRLTGRLTQSAYVPGTPITITLEPTAYGLAVTPSGAPDVRVVRPDGVGFSVPVTHTPQGSYVGTWTDTGLLGTYQFSATVKVQTLGALLSRNWTGSSLIRPVVTITPDEAAQYAAAVGESLVPLPFPDPTGGGGPGGYGDPDCRRPPSCKYGHRRPYQPCPCCSAHGRCDCCAHSCRCDCHPHAAHALLHKLASLLRR